MFILVERLDFLIINLALPPLSPKKIKMLNPSLIISNQEIVVDYF
jgi:hypothetical protein